MRAIDIYLAVFRSLNRGNRVGCGSAGDELHPASWPYDAGDDPSFYCAKTAGANLTWGVCRQQVRNRIRSGDIVVFFSVRGNRKDKAPFGYRLCALATVEQKVTQADIWARAELKRYRSYRNLLIRPGGRATWKHHEPMQGMNHKDWLWRVANHDDLRQKGFRRFEACDLLPAGAKIRGRPVSIGKNYVIFSAQSNETRILAHPPLVARCERNGQSEKWRVDRISRAIYAHTLDVARKHGSRRQSLRSANTQHAHPIIRWSMSPDEAARWRSRLLEIFTWVD